MMVAVPQSVRAYFQDQDVMTAVDLLLSKESPKIPENLTWSEMSAFYQAQLAARQTQLEYAMLMSDLWHELWTIPSRRWTSRTPSRPGGKDLSVAAADVWKDHWFARQFVADGWTLELAIWFDEVSGVQLAVGLWDDDDDCRTTDGMIDGWETETSDFIFSADGLVPVAQTLDLSPLTAEAPAVLERLFALVGIRA